jgi:hypothetical protein
MRAENNMELKLTADRLHKLKPSEIKYLKAQVQTADGLKQIVEAFANYLREIHSPDAVDRDDVYRLSSEMNTIGLWKRVNPASFVQGFQPYFDQEVWVALAEALHVQNPERRGHWRRNNWDDFLRLRKADSRADKEEFVVTYVHLPMSEGPTETRKSVLSDWLRQRRDVLMRNEATGEALIVESKGSRRRHP